MPKDGRSILDRRLEDRVSQAVRPGEHMELDELVGVLREVYPEYRRQKLNPFARKVEEILSNRDEGSEACLPPLQGLTTPKESEPAVASAPDTVVPSQLNTSITRMYNQAAVLAQATAAGPPAQVVHGMASKDGNDGGQTNTEHNFGAIGGKSGAGGADTMLPLLSISEQPSEARHPAVDSKQQDDDSNITSKLHKKRVKSSDLKSRSQKRGRESAGEAGPAAKKSSIVSPKRIHYSDLGGIEDVLFDIQQLIEYPLMHPEVYAWLGVQPPRGVLLYGPPGCGKTALANAIANECNVPFLRISAPEIVSGMSGESEAKLRELFADAAAAAPSILFIDEIDAIAPKRENAQREMERRIVAQMLTCMDDLTPAQATPSAPESATGSAQDPPKGAVDGVKHVVVIGATNRPDALDPALRRAGRFDREISLGIPGESAREKILKVLCRSLRLGGGVDMGAVAQATPGYVGADLSALTKEAAALAVTRVFAHLEVASAAQIASSGGTGDPDCAMQLEDGADAEKTVRQTLVKRGPLTAAELEAVAITAQDFEGALKKVQPSVRREGFSTKPDVSWADVGSLEGIKEELQFSISMPIRYPDQYAALGVSVATGILLFGPPGCGKTLVAKAAAADCGANFISIKGPELLNKYVGESERAIRQLFSRARAAKPCVVFFDELDALAPRRSGGDSNHSSERCGLTRLSWDSARCCCTRAILKRSHHVTKDNPVFA